MSTKLCDNMALSKSSKTKVFVMFLKLQVLSILKANSFFLSKLLVSIVFPKHDFIVHQAIYSTSRRKDTAFRKCLSKNFNQIDFRRT